MNKRIKDILTVVAFYLAISFAITLPNYWLGVLVIAATAVAFQWSLDRNVSYGYHLAKEEEDGL